MHLTSGYGHSVWAGSTRSGPAATLYRLDTRSGRIMATATLPDGTAAYDLSYYPYPAECCSFYASAARIIEGGPAGNLVLEFDAINGQPVATADHGPVTESVAGSAVTAVPDGVWDSFRTGMLGLSLHLRQADLALTAPTTAGLALSPATGMFHWAMYATTIFGGGSLWMTNQSGRLACLDPGNGRIRAIERLRQSQLVYQLFAADPSRHLLFGAVSHGLVAISPPAACWVAAPKPSISG
jgi:outer membrane protein assembly factor BamB